MNHERNREGFGGCSTPLTGNYPFGAMVQPAGENYSIGSYKSENTNEVYSWVHNSLGVHYIIRVSDANGLELVYENWGDNCLKLSADPKHSIEDWRATLRREKVYDKRGGIGCRNRHGKYLVWTDGVNEIGYLDVEASILTNSFRTPFFALCPDYCSLVRLCVPDPCTIIQATLVPRVGVSSMSNKILDAGFKFIYRWVYYDERKSEWSTPSTLYYQTTVNCFDTPESLPRCYKLRLPIGNPMVERIEVAFNKGDKTTEGNTDIWFSYEIIDKYKKYNSTQQFWYERDLSERITSDDSNFSDVDCAFDYIFCNDRNCNPVETPRTYNPMPITPQGLMPFKDGVGFYNFIQGNCPMDKFETDKIKIGIDCTDTGSCNVELVEVVVRAVIIEKGGTIGYVYRKGGIFGDSTDDTSDTAYFGGNGMLEGSFALGQAGHLGQTFNNARNFTAYIEGTDYFVEMKQWRAKNLLVAPVEYGILGGFQNSDPNNADSNPVAVLRARNLTGQAFFYQEAIFKVPKGTRGIIRLMSHESGVHDPDTSTYVIGTTPLNQLATGYDHISNVSTATANDLHEITFDTCGLAGNRLEINDAFLILVFSYYDHVPVRFSCYVSDIDNKPIEGLRIRLNSIMLAYQYTDHNGFVSLIYFFDEVDDVQPVNIDFFGELDCAAFAVVQSLIVSGQWGEEVPIAVKVTNPAYAKFYESLSLAVGDCNNEGVAGLRVAITGSKYQTTGINGVATFKLRNYYTRNRSVRGYVMDRNGCFKFNCYDDCGPCTTQTPLIPLMACFISTPSMSLEFPDLINVDRVTVQGRGLKRGGRYPMGYVIHGNCGRISAVNELPYLDIPKRQDSGTGAFCSLSYDMTGVVLPAWATCVEIVRGENINTWELQWVVDTFEKTSDGKIKITFQTLIDYNNLYPTATNTRYQWLEGDRIEFIADENGKPISIAGHGILNYQTISPFNDIAISNDTTTTELFNQVVIIDDGKIDFLKAGSIIELQRPRECLVEPVYFSIGVSLDVVNGVLLNPVGSFDTFDTYQIRRVIGGGALLTFEHHSPSDFWGARLTDIGKPYFANRYENERRFNQSITLNSPTQYNRFGDIVKTFDGLSSDIISMNIKDGKIIMIICETDNALAQAADDLLRVGADGVIRAAPPDAIISDGEPKLAGEYGCDYSSIGSIFYGDGFANWYDIRYYSYINNDYRTAKSVDDTKARSYFRKIGMRINLTNRTQLNPLNKLRFSTGLNVQTDAVSLTLKSLRHSAVNNDVKLYTSPNVTILYHNGSEDFLTLASYTPESYSNLVVTDGFGCAMIVFQNGLPYIHPMVAANYNEFFGVACDRVIGISINGEGKMPQKNKLPVSFELQSDKMYYVVSVETSDPDFASEIPPIRIQRNESKWNGSFLSNANGRGGLYGGAQSARDYYINVTFRRDNTNGLQYGTINNLKRTELDVLSLIIFNFSVSEQSGFTLMQTQ